jgi:hypothetical protein
LRTLCAQFAAFQLTKTTNKHCIYMHYINLVPVAGLEPARLFMVPGF